MQIQIRIHFRASERSLPYWCLNLNSLLVNSKMTILHLVRYCHFGVSPVNYSDSDLALAETRTCHFPHSQPLVKHCHFWYITSKLYRLKLIKTNAILLFWQFICKPVYKTFFCFIRFTVSTSGWRMPKLTIICECCFA